MTRTLSAYANFIWAGLLKQVQTGGIIPSQRFLVAKMIAPVPVDYEGEIIELGAGTGALTLRLAARCPAARILACEINPMLARSTRASLASSALRDRAQVRCESAEHLLSRLSRKGAPKADFVISGVPIGNLGRQRALELVHAISESLAPGGMYIQFQHFLADLAKIRARFDRMRIVPVALNLPPAVVYYAWKAAARREPLLTQCPAGRNCQFPAT
jgi:phospholipid N-methyltransferase